MSIRIDKYLSNHGFCSRRQVSDFLNTHNVEVEGERIEEPGFRIQSKNNQVLVDGQLVESEEKVYYIVNKPVGYVSTVSDEHMRKTVLDLLPQEITTKYRLYPVGRLDQDSEGLILLTNDGELTHQLTHPTKHVPKTYHLSIKGKVKSGYLQMIRRGIKLKHFQTQPAKVKKIEATEGLTRLELTIHEGKNRQIRRMCKALNLELINLKRVAIGSIEVGDLREGEWRAVTKQELRE